MKYAVRLSLAVIVSALLVASTGYAGEPVFTGFLVDYKDLAPGPEDGADFRYIKAGVDFKKYKKVMLDNVVFFFAEDSKYKGIESTTLTELSKTFNEEVVKALGNDFPIVAAPGPDVMRVRVAITKLEGANPGRSVVSSVVPVAMALSVVQKAVTGGWTGVGRTGIELEALDSLTNERIGAAVHEHIGSKASSFTTWGSAREAFQFWAGRMRVMLDKARELP